MERISKLGWNKFNKHLKNKKRTYETKVFIIDMLWQMFFNQNTYKESRLFKECIYVMLQQNENLIKFTDAENNLKIIEDILFQPNLKQIFSEFLVSSDQQDYEQKIMAILQNTFLAELPSEHHGVTLINKSIVINSSQVFLNELFVSAYRLLILIHEIGHVIVRNDCTTAMQCLEYQSKESSFEESPESQTGMQSEPESGFQLEAKLFGRFKNLNELAANFMTVPGN